MRPNQTAAAATLIAIFQRAIVDLTQKIEREKHTLSAADVESAHVVVGIAALNAFNLEQVINQGADYYERNRQKVDRLLREASQFAESLQAEGFGKYLV